MILFFSILMNCYSCKKYEYGHLFFDYSKIKSGVLSKVNAADCKKLQAANIDTFDLEKIKNLKKLKYLIIQKKEINLKDVIDNLNSRENIIRLQLINMDSLPENISKLKKLEKLIIQSGSLHSIPNEIGDLSKLEILDLGTEMRPFQLRNSISELPNTIVKLNNLVALSIARNKFIEFPIDICKLKGLKYLCIDDNNIKKLPDCICELPNLVYVIYDKDKIKIDTNSCLFEKFNLQDKMLRSKKQMLR